MKCISARVGASHSIGATHDLCYRFLNEHDPQLVGTCWMCTQQLPSGPYWDQVICHNTSGNTIYKQPTGILISITLGSIGAVDTTIHNSLQGVSATAMIIVRQNRQHRHQGTVRHPALPDLFGFGHALKNRQFTTMTWRKVAGVFGPRKWWETIIVKNHFQALVSLLHPIWEFETDSKTKTIHDLPKLSSMKVRLDMAWHRFLSPHSSFTSVCTSSLSHKHHVLRLRYIGVSIAKMEVIIEDVQGCHNPCWKTMKHGSFFWLRDSISAFFGCRQFGITLPLDPEWVQTLF